MKEDLKKGREKLMIYLKFALDLLLGEADVVGKVLPVGLFHEGQVPGQLLYCNHRPPDR